MKVIKNIVCFYGVVFSLKILTASSSIILSSATIADMNANIANANKYQANIQKAAAKYTSSPETVASYEEYLQMVGPYYQSWTNLLSLPVAVEFPAILFAAHKNLVGCTLAVHNCAKSLSLTSQDIAAINKALSSVGNSVDIRLCYSAWPSKNLMYIITDNASNMCISYGLITTTLTGVPSYWYVASTYAGSGAASGKQNINGVIRLVRS